MSGLTQIAVFVLTNTRWAQILDERQQEIQIADGRNPNANGRNTGGNAGNPAGRVRMQIARGFPLYHRTFSIFLTVVDED